ncbi:Hypothetical protein CINCED_3A024077 [Cinara cedri]|uniref:Uncharacterized protein n=1 Tax=Cinara cedri TaxID=506608 RepID=A0A5E4N433_9HEMI|nr:Hypothetical protein CINCED_3A024077 [Cinara cedri]
MENKRPLCVAIIKPIWTYGVQLCGRASKSNVDTIQRGQKTSFSGPSLRPTGSKETTPFAAIFLLPTTAEEIRKSARKHGRRLEDRINPAAVELLDNSKDTRRLKRPEPHGSV